MRQELRIPPSPEYSNVITEMGVCYSSSELMYIQKPYRGIDLSIPDRVPDNTLYSSVDVMRLIITPHILDTGNVTIVGITYAFVDKLLRQLALYNPLLYQLIFKLIPTFCSIFTTKMML